MWSVMLVFSQRPIHPRSAQSLFLSLDSLFRRPSTYWHSKLILTPSTLSSFLRCIYHSANGDSHVLPISLLVASAIRYSRRQELADKNRASKKTKALLRSTTECRIKSTPSQQLLISFYSKPWCYRSQGGMVKVELLYDIWIWIQVCTEKVPLVFGDCQRFQ
jgi:hypothetical protein